MEIDQILVRVERRLAKMGLSAAAASKLAGKPDAIRNLQRAVEAGNRQGVSTATLNALAPVLGTTAVWLLAEAGPEDHDAPLASSVSRNVADAGFVGDLRQVTARQISAIYGGVVEAGSFRPVDDFDDEAHVRPPRYEAVDDEFPDAKIVVFDVSGDSMNALKPHAIPPGFRVVCLDFESLRNRAPVRDGMVVVVEQRLNGGLLRERSVKQVQLYRDRTEYCPRSTNPKHKPIVVPHDQAPEDGREVEILAIVRRITTDVRI